MMQILVPQDDSVSRWVASRLPDEGVTFAPLDRAVGVVRDEKLVAGAVYHDHNPTTRNVQLSFAAEGQWASRRTVAAILWPAFKDMGCQRITALIRKKNRKSRALVEKVGFKHEGTLRKGFGDDAMCLYGLMHWEADKWLEKYNG